MKEPSLSLSADECIRYHRQMLLPQVGVEGQLRLRRSAVLVVGAGGLGLPLMHYLAGAGVGRIGIMDGDCIELSNLHRQVWFQQQQVGQMKAVVAAATVRQLNPQVQVEAICEFFDTITGADRVKDFDWIADCTDNFSSRYQINDVCVKAGRPFISGAVQGNTLQVAVLNRNGGGTYRCLYPEPPEPDQAPACDQAGILNTVPGLCGLLMAHELQQLLLGAATRTGSYLLTADLGSLTLQYLSVARDPWAVKSLLEQPLQHPDAYRRWCAREYSNQIVRELTATELQQLQLREPLCLLDVREEAEVGTAVNGSLHIPFGELMRRAGEIPRHQPVVLLCSIGFRSFVAVQRLQERFGFLNLFHLKGGLRALSGHDLRAVIPSGQEAAG